MLERVVARALAPRVEAVAAVVAVAAADAAKWAKGVRAGAPFFICRGHTGTCT